MIFGSLLIYLILVLNSYFDLFILVKSNSQLMLIIYSKGEHDFLVIKTSKIDCFECLC